MKKKGILKKSVLLLLAVITMLSCGAMAFAAGWNGDGATGGGASSNASGEYAVLRGTTAESMIVGYRFSGRLADGKTIPGSTEDEERKSIDVILKQEEHNINLLKKMVSQYSKADYFQEACRANNEISPDNIKYLVADALLGDNKYTYLESELESEFLTNLPHDSTDLDGDLDAWQAQDKNLDVIARLLGWESLAKMAFNDRIYIEPLYAVRILGEDLMLTSTEIAWYGAMLYGWDFNGENNGATNPQNPKDPNYWAFIGNNFTHRRIPNALYAPEQVGSLGWTLATGIQKDERQYNLTSYDILTGSWGVGICYIKETTIPDIVVSNMQVVLEDGTKVPPDAVPKDQYVYVWATITNNSAQKQKINLYQYAGSTCIVPVTDANHSKYYPATSQILGGAQKDGWLPNFSSSTTATPFSFIILPGKTIQVRVAYTKFTSNTYVHFAAWLDGKRFTTTTMGTIDGCNEVSKINNYTYTLIKPIIYTPNLKMTNIKLCSDENGNTEYPKDSNGVYQIPQGNTVYVFMKWKNTSDHKVGYDVYDIERGGSFANPGKTGTLASNTGVGWTLYHSFIAQSTATVTREAHVYLQGKTDATGETTTTDNVKTYRYKAIPQNVTVTINHYLMNTDGSTYTCKESSYDTITPGTTITAANYKKSYPGFKYEYAQVDHNTVTTVYIDRTKTINLYYKREMYTVTLYNGTGINGTTGSGTYYYGATVNIDATVAEGYHWVNWTGTDTLVKKGTSFIMPDADVTLTANGDPYRLLINYYSNYATTAFSGAMNAVGSDKNVLVRQYEVKYWDTMPDGLHDYSYSTADTYLYRNRWYSNGRWNTETDGSGISIDQGTGFAYAKDLAQALGVPLLNQDQTIDLYPEWTPHYDVELMDIYFKAYDSNGNTYTLSETQQQNIPVGTKVYVFYRYKNRSPVPVKVTGYNTNGAAISYNGSTSYEIPGWDGILTVQAGSFVATHLGAGNMNGSVYINGLKVSDESTDIDGNATINNTRTESYGVKFDVEIADIYLADYDGNMIDMNSGIPTNSEVVIHHIYRNNSGVDITVNGYDNAGNKITYNGTQKFTIPAYGTIDIIAGKMRTPAEPGTFTINGAVYRDGKTAATEKDEWDLNNNVFGTAIDSKDYATELAPYLVPLEPNASYRANTDVITSYQLVNPTTNNYTPNTPISVRIKVYDGYSGKLITTLSKTTIVPAGETQLVYFKWHVPYFENYEDIKIVADLKLPGYDYWSARVSRTYEYNLWSVFYTPDTDYESKQPADWRVPGALPDESGKASWSVWEYVNGKFVYQSYGIQASGGQLTLIPQSKTAYEKNGMWYMKSGYGFTAEAAEATISKLAGSTYKKPGTDAYTGAQYAYMCYPEFRYLVSITTVDTMEMVDGRWHLFEFLHYGRVHFTPIWYPDCVYNAVMVQSDIWTPMGMITTQKVSSVVIDGDMYDDWYVQGT